MFRCERCNKVKGPYKKSVRVPVETRKMTYKEVWTTEGRRRELLDKGGSGWETARELLVCEACEKALIAEDKDR